jgi:DNA sulfur modification protein DndD
MLIKKIKVQNFGILADVEIDFNNELQHLAFINARNSRGKTSLLSALKWALIGEQQNWAEQVNNWSLKKTKNEDSISVKVTVEVLLDRSEGTAIIERSVSFETKMQKISKSNGVETITVKNRPDAKGAFTEVAVRPEAWLDTHFPKRLKNFFLFDGETMQKFFDTNVQSYIADAVREIAGVDHFESLAVQFKKVEEQANKKIASMGGDKTIKSEDDYRKATRYESLLEQEIKNTQKLLGDAEQSLEDVIDKRRGQDFSAEQAQRSQDIAAYIKKATEDKKVAEAEFEKKVLSNGIKGLLHPLFGAVEREYERALEIGIDVPPKFDPKHIREMLDSGNCICGCDLNANPNSRQELSKLIDKSANASLIGKILDKTNDQLKRLLFAAEGQLELIDKSNLEVTRLSNYINDLRAEQDELAALGIGAEPASFAQALAHDQKRLQSEIYQFSTELGSMQSDLAIAKKQTEKAKADFEKATRGLDGSKNFKVQSDLARELSEAAGQIHKIALESVRNKLELAMEEKFSKLAGAAYKTKVTTDFEVLTLNANGDEINLSAGLQMMKGYVFAIALREVINLGLPLVVDSPFGRLDQVFVEEVSGMLAELASTEFEDSSRQIVFLMHDGEYTPYTRRHFLASNPYESYLAWEIDGEKSVSGIGLDPAWFNHTAWKDWKEGKIQ